MKITGLHMLWTYRCIYQCDHCFVRSGPQKDGTMSLADFQIYLDQARQAGTIESFFFEGGEPFLYYGALLEAVRLTARAGYRVGIVTNAYWAVSEVDALAWLKPLSDSLDLLSISTDRYHSDSDFSQTALNARAAAESLNMDCNLLRVGPPDGKSGEEEGGVRFRGRAADRLVEKAPGYDWRVFTACPDEDLRDPGRVHVDPYGNVHICQGIVIGNMLEKPLKEIIASYRPDDHPVLGPLLKGGPAELAASHGFRLEDSCPDACFLCYRTRDYLRRKYPFCLRPEQVYRD